MNDLDKTQPLPSYVPKGEEIIPLRRSPGYRKPLLIGGGALLALWVAVSGLTSAFGNSDHTPAPRQPAVVQEREPKPVAPREDTSYDKGRELGRAYNDAKKESGDFLKGFTDETTVDETLKDLGKKGGELLDQGARELDRQLSESGS